MTRRNHAITLLQATQDSPTLAHLSALAAESTARFRQIEALLPPTLRTSVRPGPIDGNVWCLLLDNNAVAAKVRQLLPALLAHLRSRGCALESIRIKVQSAQP